MPVVPMKANPGQKQMFDRQYMEQTDRQVIDPSGSRAIIHQDMPQPSPMALILTAATMEAEGKLFDPEGSGYDYEGAKAAGLSPKAVDHDDKPHWPSRDPKTGVLLKGRNHPSFQTGLDEDEKMGYQLKKRKDGRYVTEKD